MTLEETYFFPNARTALNGIRQVAKELFVAEKKRVLSRLPSSYKRLFGQIGFVDNCRRPILILSPFDVPPGNIRTSWNVTFQEFLLTNDADILPYLAYHYDAAAAAATAQSNGNKKTIDDFLFSVVRSEDFIPYEDGKEQGFCRKMLKDIKRAASSLEHSVTDEKQHKLLLASYLELEQDLVKEPGKRIRGPSFQEFYELLEIASPETKSEDSFLEKKKDQKVARNDRIDVWWEGEKSFFRGTVKDLRDSFMYVLYDDGDREWTPKDERVFKIVGASDSSRCSSKMKLESSSDMTYLHPTKLKQKMKLLLDSKSSSSSRSVESSLKYRTTSLRPLKKELLRATPASSCDIDEKHSLKEKLRQKYIKKHGYVAPKATPAMLPDGSYKRPMGRQREGCIWDYDLGLWAPEGDFANRRLANIEAAAASKTLGKRQSHRGQDQSPKRKRRLVVSDDDNTANDNKDALENVVAKVHDVNMADIPCDASSQRGTTQNPVEKVEFSPKHVAKSLDANDTNENCISTTRKEIGQINEAKVEMSPTYGSCVDKTKHLSELHSQTKSVDFLLKNQDEIESELPECYLTSFDSFVFDKSDGFKPAYILSPFDVTNETFATQWRKKFETLSSKKSLKTLPFVVSKCLNKETSKFSLGWLIREDAITWEEGLKAGHHSLAHKVMFRKYSNDYFSRAMDADFPQASDREKEEKESSGFRKSKHVFSDSGDEQASSTSCQESERLARCFQNDKATSKDAVSDNTTDDNGKVTKEPNNPLKEDNHTNWQRVIKAEPDLDMEQSFPSEDEGKVDAKSDETEEESMIDSSVSEASDSSVSDSSVSLDVESKVEQIRRDLESLHDEAGLSEASVKRVFDLLNILSEMKLSMEIIEKSKISIAVKAFKEINPLKTLVKTVLKSMKNTYMKGKEIVDQEKMIVGQWREAVNSSDSATVESSVSLFAKLVLQHKLDEKLVYELGLVDLMAKTGEILFKDNLKSNAYEYVHKHIMKLLTSISAHV